MGSTSVIIFFKPVVEQEPPDEKHVDRLRFVARASYVFNADQVDDWTPPQPTVALTPMDRIAAADRFFAAISSVILHGGDLRLLSAGYRHNP